MRQRVGCPYLADVQARWDGELTEARAAEVQAHLHGCGICQEQQRSLERLAEALRKGDVGGSCPQAEHERMKGALLERCVITLPSGAAVASQTQSNSHTGRRKWLLVSAVTVCVVVLV